MYGLGTCGGETYPRCHEVGVIEVGVVGNRVVPGDLVLFTLMERDIGSQVD